MTSEVEPPRPATLEEAAAVFAAVSVYVSRVHGQEAKAADLSRWFEELRRVIVALQLVTTDEGER